jgi:hypothetical protein
MKGAEDLVFGSMITLRVSNEEYMTSKGFIDNSLYVTGDENIDFTDAVFQILPQCIYTTQQDVLDKISNLPRSDAAESVIRKHDNLEGEFKTNIQTYHDFKGKPVVYGSLIQLLHVNSQKYLVHKSGEDATNASIEKENLKICLEDYGSEFSHFRIRPSYQFQKSRSGIVKSGDKIYLEGHSPRLSKNICLHMSGSTFFYTIASESRYQVSEVNASLDSKTDWEISIYSSVPDSDAGVLEYGDCVWITHSEEESSLVGRYNLVGGDIYLNTNTYDSNGLWIIETKEYKSGGKVKVGNEFRLRHLSTGKYLGVVLGDSLIDLQMSDRKNSLVLCDRCGENTLWNLTHCTYKEEEKHQNCEDNVCLYNDDYYRFMNLTANLYIGCKESTSIEHTSKLDVSVEYGCDDLNVFKVSRAERNIVWMTSFLQHCFPILKSFPLFVEKMLDIEQPSFDEIQEVDKTLMSTNKCLEDLNLYCKNELPSMMGLDKQYGEIQFFRQNNLREQCFIEALVSILDSLFQDHEARDFIRTSLVGYDLSSDGSMRVEESYIGKLNKYEKFKKFCYDNLKLITQNIYKLLTTLSINNTTNQEYIFKYFNIFRKHIGLELGATECILSILSQNENLLLKLHRPSLQSFKPYETQFTQDEDSRSLIDFYCHALSDNFYDRKVNLLRFLKNICSFHGDGVTVNQEKVYENIIADDEYYRKVIIPMKFTRRSSIKIEVYSPDIHDMKPLDLREACKEELDSITNNQIRYFVTQLGLLADLCLGRNSICINSLKAKFPIYRLKNLLWNESLSVSIRASVARLILNIHIDTSPREESHKPELIKLIKVSFKSTKSHMASSRSMSTFGIMDSAIIKLRTRVFTDYEPVPQSLPTVVPGQESVTYRAPTTYQEIKLSDEEIPLYELADTLLSYFNDLNSSSDSSNELTLEMIKIAKKLVLFEVYGTSYTLIEEGICILPQNRSMSPNDMGIFKVTNVLLQFLLKNIRLVSGLYERSKIVRPSFMLLSPVHGGDKLTPSFLDLATSDNDAGFNPLFNKALNLRNYLNSILTSSESDKSDTSYDSACKEEICNVVNLYLNWRLDFLIYNIIEWYNQINNKQPIKGEQVSGLLPLVMKLGNKLANHEIYEEPHQECEEAFYQMIPTMIPDLNDVFGREISPYLIKAFTKAPSIKLQSQLLRIVIRCYSQKKELISSIKKLYIISDTTEANVYAWAKLNVHRLKEICYQSEIWIKHWDYTYENQSSQTWMFQSILTLFDSLSKLLKKDSTIENGIPSKGTGKISKKRQLLLFYLDLHTCLIKLIKDSFYVLQEVYDRIGDEIYNTKLEYLFRKCFNLLESITQDNYEIQKAMKPHIPLFLSNLRIEVNQIDLCCAIYKDNIELCSSLKEEDLKPFTDAILHLGRQARFLKFFKQVMLIHKNPVTSIQTLILNTFLGKDSENLLFLRHGSSKDRKFTLTPTASIRNRPVYEQTSDEYLVYHAEIINILSLACLGTTNLSLNEAKCQKIVPIGYLFQLLFKAEVGRNGMSILKMPLLNFLYNVYLDIEKRYDDMKSYNKFMEYIKLQSQNLTEQKYVGQEYAEFLSIWLKILNCYYDKYSQGYSWNYDNEDTITISSYLENFIDNVYRYNFKVDPKLIEILAKLCLRLNLDITNIDLSSIILEISEDSLRDNFPSLSRGSSEVSDDNWESFREIFTQSRAILKKIKGEKKQLLYLIYHISEYVTDLNFDTIVKSLVQFIRQSRINDLPHDMVIQAVKLLTDIVAHPHLLRKEKRHTARIRIQNELQSYGTGQTALSLECDPKVEPELFEAVLSFSVYYLDGGNQNVQNEFYKFFTNVPNSEIFFEKLDKLMSNHMENTLIVDIRDKSNETQYKQDDILIRLVLRFLQLLCENHHNSLQKYLRFQENSRISYNLVERTIKLLEILLKEKYAYSFSIISQCFDTLTEMIQGPCRENQQELVDSKFLDLAASLLCIDEEYYKTCSIYDHGHKKVLKKLMHSDSVQRLEGWMISHLKYKCMITIHALLEGGTDSYIITRLIRALNIDMLKENLVNIYKAYKNKYGGNYYENDVFNHFISQRKVQKIRNIKTVKSSSRPIIELGFLIYFLLRHFHDNEDPENSEITKNIIPSKSISSSNHSEGIGMAYLRWLESIGIVLYTNKQKNRQIGDESKIQDKNILSEAFYFFQKHTGNIEVVFTNNILTKVYFPIPPESSSLTIEIKENFQANVDRTTYKTKLQGLVNETTKIIEEYKHEHRLNKVFKKYKLLNFITANNSLWKDLAFMNTLLINFLILASYSEYHNTHRLKEPSFLYGEDRDIYGGLTSEQTLNLFAVLGAFQCGFAVMVVFFYILKTAPVQGKRGWKKVKAHQGPNKQPILAKAIQFTMKLSFALYYVMNANVLFYISYLIFALFGILIHPFFFSYHLFEILYRFPSLQNVIKSVSVPKKSLFLTFVFTLVLVYIFGLLGYYWFYEYFQGNCPSLFVCTLSVFDKGFKSDGGIGGYLDPWTTGEIYFGRYFYDNAYNILVMIIMLNIVQGIIIDTFAVLRQKSEASIEDRENVCFICNVDRCSMERRTDQNFLNHRRFDHNEWHYVFFIGYLLEKDPVEYTGIESHIRSRYDKRDISWFPRRRAIAFKETFEDDEDIIKSKQNQIDSKLNLIERKFDEFIKNR